MVITNSVIRWVIIGLIVLLLVPVVLMLGMMAIGAMSGGSMMSHMGGMMGSGSSGMMGGPGMVWGVVWLTLVAAALIFLIALLARNSEPPGSSDKAA